MFLPFWLKPVTGEVTVHNADPIQPVMVGNGANIVPTGFDDILDERLRVCL